jgi:NitT/TauT family transport system substrate-binding protein
MIGANRDYVRKHPVATKQVVRAILKGADICSAEPDAAAAYIVSRGYTGEPAYALESIRQIRYTRWRDQDPADSARFYALRLREAGMIKSSPNRLIAQGTDWRFFNEVRAELRT